MAEALAYADFVADGLSRNGLKFGTDDMIMDVTGGEIVHIWMHAHSASGDRFRIEITPKGIETFAWWTNTKKASRGWERYEL